MCAMSQAIEQLDVATALYYRSLSCEVAAHILDDRCVHRLSPFYPAFRADENDRFHRLPLALSLLFLFEVP